MGDNFSSGFHVDAAVDIGVTVGACTVQERNDLTLPIP
jgi:hypothetical protein